MARREIQSEGKDVATAIIRGLNELGRRRDQVEVTVIQEEKSGFLGIGGRPAIVRIIEKKWDSEHSTPMKPRSASKESSFGGGKGRGGRGKGGKDFKKGGRKSRGERVKTPKENEPQKLPSAEIQNAIVPEDMKPALQSAKETLGKMLSSMGVQAENLNVWWDAKQQRILLTFDCDHPAIVIGKEGKTLESIQYIITLVVSRQFNTPISVMADTQNYWRKLEDKINNEIDKALSMVKRTKRVYRFRPMSAQMRRYIHRFLADNLEITTISEGEGKWRKVVIKAEARQAPAAQDNTKKAFVEQEVSEGDIAAHCNDGEHTEGVKTEEAKSEEVKAETAAAAENTPCDCALTAESTSCECAGGDKSEACDCGNKEEGNTCSECTCGKAEQAPVADTEVKAEEVKAAEPAAENVPAEQAAAPAENTSCGCTLTAESTSCECAGGDKSENETCSCGNKEEAHTCPECTCGKAEQAPVADTEVKAEEVKAPEPAAQTLTEAAPLTEGEEKAQPAENK